VKAEFSAPAAADVDELVRAHLPLVGHIVREVLGRVPSHVRRDELISAGMYALTVSAASFEASRGVPFARFAALRIRGGITDELRSMDWASRSVRSKSREVETARAGLTRALGRTPNTAEIAQAVGFEPAEVEAVDADVQRASVLSLQALTVDGDYDTLPAASDSPEGLLLRREQIGYLHDAIAELPERLRTVVTQYFFEQRKMSEIAADLGVTESRISQLRSEALALLYVGFQAGYERSEPAPEQPVRGRAAAARSAYVASVAARSSLAGRLSATTVLGEPRVGAGPNLRPAI
jgi:RNA polymerase sigma factor for flagellar operon FliA